MLQDLRSLETDALNAQKSGDYLKAIELWTNLLARAPRWEHGYPHYHMADCYTRVGKFDLAERSYRAAIALAPEDEMFSIALGSLIEARKSGVL